SCSRKNATTCKAILPAVHSIFRPISRTKSLPDKGWPPPTAGGLSAIRSHRRQAAVNVLFVNSLSPSPIHATPPWIGLGVCGLTKRTTFAVHGAAASRSIRLQHSPSIGVQVTTIPAIAARLAGGFVQPIGIDELRMAIAAALDAAALGELEP